LEVSFAEPSDFNRDFPSLLGVDVLGDFRFTYHLGQNLVSLE
jgi:hypothetical protein